jgi:ABC-type transporter Mla MlaB component
MNKEHLVDNDLIQTGTKDNSQQQTTVNKVEEPIKSIDREAAANLDNRMKANTAAGITTSASKNQSTNIVLDSVLTITEAGSLYNHLQSFIDTEGDVTIDASKVQMIDMAGLQLLLVFVRELRKCQRNLHWQNPSPILKQRAELMDLSRQLRL